MSTAVAERPPSGHGSTPDHRAGEELSHKEILEVMVGLLAALFTALISSTIVSTALPTIMGELHGTQRQYTWVITVSLLAMTISTPIMGKLSDLVNKKLLIQLSIVLFVAGSVFAGFSQEIWQLMAGRALQGIAMGGLTSLTQSILGTIIAPRQRGRYSGYMGAVMAVATVSGPLLGGVITDNLNWRWCFFVCVPLAIIALTLLQVTLKLPALEKREVKIDYFGGLFLAIAAAIPMLWVTFAGADYDWISWQSGLFLLGFLIASAIAVIIELNHAEPIVPIRVLRNSTTVLMIITGMAVGVAMFGMGTFMTQYFQLAGGHSPTKAGLMTIPLIVAQMLSSVIGGQIVSRTGRWKPVMVIGATLVVVGLGGLGLGLDSSTPFWQVAIWMAVAGIGVGALVQNIVLAVQNTVDVRDVGASSATISFFRSLGGAVGVTILGAVLADQVETKTIDGVKALPATLQAVAAKALGGGGGDLDLAGLPDPIERLVRHAYGDTFGTLFLIAGIIAVAALIAVLLVHEVPLRLTVAMEPKAKQPVDGADAVEPSTVDQQLELTSTAVGATDAAPDKNVNGHHERRVNTANLTTNLHTSSHQPAAHSAEHRPADDFDEALLDDPAGRRSVAALDVLTAAQDRVRQYDAGYRDSLNQIALKLDSVSHEVDAAIGGFHRQLQSIRDDLLAAKPGTAEPRPDGAGGDELRQYEYNLLLDSQQTADRVAASARSEAERILTDAEQQHAELERRIEQLREVERELSSQVTHRLAPTDDHSPDA